MAITVLLVDDQSLLRMGFRMVLEAEEDISVVGEAADGDAAIRMVGALQPDVVLMDVRMPGVNGIEATQEIITAHPSTRVLILTTFDLDEYAFDGLRAGASGFLLKDTPPAELLHAIRTIHSGEAVVSARITQRMLELFATSLPESRIDEQGSNAAVADLTEREQDVLLALAQGRSNTEIATDLFVSEATVKTHVGKVLSKLGLRDRVQAVIFAYENGIVHPA